jgi:hypothetical protein
MPRNLRLLDKNNSDRKQRAARLEHPGQTGQTDLQYDNENRLPTGVFPQNTADVTHSGHEKRKKEKTHSQDSNGCRQCTDYSVTLLANHQTCFRNFFNLFDFNVIPSEVKMFHILILLTPWSRVLLKKLRVHSASQEIPHIL